MTDRPIIFSAPMVRTLLTGQKTQTRRLVSSPLVKCMPGDRLWVRENFTTGFEYDADEKPVGERLIVYAASYQFGRWYDPDQDEWRDQPRWTPSIHMPRSASRLTLVVTEVKRQRLNALSCSDAIAEGIPPAANSQTIDCDTADPRDAFAVLWNSLHGPDAWAANPEVVALSFAVHRCNIDQLGKEEA